MALNVLHSLLTARLMMDTTAADYLERQYTEANFAFRDLLWFSG